MSHTRQAIGSFCGEDVVLSIIKDQSLDYRELCIIIPGMHGDEIEGLTFRYRSTEGGKQIVQHIIYLAKKHGWDGIDDIIWSEDWLHRFHMWSEMS
jgi:hypothetical protein